MSVDTKTLDKKIVSIRNHTKTLKADVQEAVELSGTLGSENGDTSRLVRLVVAMGNGLRRDSLVAHIETNTPVKCKKAKPDAKDTFEIEGTQYTLGLPKGWTVAEFDFDGLKNDWTLAKREGKVTAMDPLSIIMAAFANYDKRVEANDDDKPVKEYTEAELDTLANIRAACG